MNDISGVKAGDNDSFEIAPNKVLIECEQDKEVFDSAIKLYKAETYKRYSKCGIVKQVGKDVVLEDCKVGDKVYYDAYAGTDVDFGGREFKIILPDHILCKVEN